MAKRDTWYDLLKYTSLGLEMGSAVVIGLLIGFFLDRKFATTPWLTLVFLGFGFAAAVRALLRAVKETTEKGKEDDGSGVGGSGV